MKTVFAIFATILTTVINPVFANNETPDFEKIISYSSQKYVDMDRCFEAKKNGIKFEELMSKEDEGSTSWIMPNKVAYSIQFNRLSNSMFVACVEYR